MSGLDDKLVTPFIYGLTFLIMTPLAGLPLLSFGFSQLPVTVYYGMPIVLLSLAFGICGLATLRLERLSHPRFVDHLRRCTLLYLGLIATTLILSFVIYRGQDQPGHVIFLLGGVVAAYAILIDGSILAIARLRAGRRGAN